MYCKKCGTQIDNDSEFCRKCGTKTTPIEKSSNVATTTIQNSAAGFATFIKFIIVIIFFGLILLGVAQCIDENNRSSSGKYYGSSSNDENKTVVQKLTTRDANSYDIEFEAETNLKKLGVDIIIHPNCDIENLEIKIEILDSNEKVIETIYKDIGSVKEGVEITRTVSITDISFINNFKTRYYRVLVVGGTVSYFN